MSLLSRPVCMGQLMSRCSSDQLVPALTSICAHPQRYESTMVTTAGGGEIDSMKYYPKVIFRHGKREVIGYGIRGTLVYFDAPQFPMPPVRFREETPYITELRSKERGDWRNLSRDEVKSLYRHTFCMTFSEMLAPNSQWKPITAGVMFCIAVAVFLYYLHIILHQRPYPRTMTDPELIRAHYQRYLDEGVGRMWGFASHWDYEKGEWKK